VIRSVQCCKQSWPRSRFSACACVKFPLRALALTFYHALALLAQFCASANALKIVWKIFKSEQKIRLNFLQFVSNSYICFNATLIRKALMGNFAKNIKHIHKFLKKMSKIEQILRILHMILSAKGAHFSSCAHLCLRSR
jgi:hypothetical protein